MDHVVTVGMIVWPALAVLGGLVVLGFLVWIISIFASGFNH